MKDIKSLINAITNVYDSICNEIDDTTNTIIRVLIKEVSEIYDWNCHDYNSLQVKYDELKKQNELLLKKRDD